MLPVGVSYHPFVPRNVILIDHIISGVRVELRNAVDMKIYCMSKVAPDSLFTQTCTSSEGCKYQYKKVSNMEQLLKQMREN